MRKILLTTTAILLIGSNALASDYIPCAEDEKDTCWPCGNTCAARLNSEHELRISGYGMMTDYKMETTADNVTYSTAPWSSSFVESIVVEDGITSIGNSAFYKMRQVKDVQIANSVTSIGARGLQALGPVTSIDLSDSVTNIGSVALASNYSLSTFKIPSGINTLSSWLFADSGIEYIDIPENITKIESYAFADTKLTSIDIPDSVTSIEDYAFRNCKDLRNIMVSDTTEIGKMFDHNYGGMLDISKIKVYCKGDTKVCDENMHQAGYDIKSLAAPKKLPDGKYTLNGANYATISDFFEGKRIKKLIYTVEEAMEATKNGDKFHVYLTYK